MGSAMVPFERAVVKFPILAVHCDHCAISNHSAAISPTLKSAGGESLRGKIWGGRG